MNKVKRLLALVLCLCMVLTLLPLGAFAAEEPMHKTDRKDTAPSAGQATATEAELPDKDGRVDLGVHVNPLYEGLIDPADFPHSRGREESCRPCGSCGNNICVRAGSGQAARRKDEAACRLYGIIRQIE